MFDLIWYDFLLEKQALSSGKKQCIHVHKTSLKDLKNIIGE